MAINLNEPWVSIKNKCCRCGSNKFICEQAPDDTPHKFKIVCVNCNHFIKWYTPKEFRRKNNRTSIRLKPEIEYCQICKRLKSELPSKCILHEHHLIDYSIRPDLDLILENRLVVCSQCHELIRLVQKIVKTITKDPLNGKAIYGNTKMERRQVVSQA